MTWVEREIGVPSLVLEGVIDGGITGGGGVATDPLLPPEGVAGEARERTISEPTMPSSDLDPPQSKKNIGTASAAHASITSKDLCWVCLVKKKKLPFFVPLTNILNPHQSCLTVVEGEPSSAEF